MITHTAIGPKYRIQFKVIDQTGVDVPVSIRQDRPTFCVYVLDASHHKSTSYSVAGKQVYYGDDPDAAYDTAKQYVPGLHSKLPKSFSEYLIRWAKDQPN